ncbi:MAG: esterase-like activity of phytase family protein [Dolichospermum sp. JUN01]|nr:esterase-like activity of phytase family protein [Dolichospermum sp. JUN01]MBS9394389.1 esterase-like activity of phytase family protein [Dolichospermum sp. OL01]MCO5798019.1 esterase-like activity of phytase family protein [Dolichospermum sp. OL03]MCS6283320.1 esterase-like activity of phytase family protein [Dolichospermum sp.]QSV59498.1 MAG: esterase-like activity of phytase family protein [Dolichospermum sp. LBC05a]
MPRLPKPRKLSLILIFIIPLILIGFLFNNFASASSIIKSIEFIGQATLPTGLIFQKTEIGGLSGITYDAKNNLYYAISDDRGQKASPRFYTFTIDLSKGKLTNNDVIPVGVTNLLNTSNQPFPPNTTDTEGIAITNQDTIFVSSEGDVDKLINPFIKEFALASGKTISTLPIPDKFLPDSQKQKGIRNNLAFESLTITPNQKFLFTATENALIQDGPAAKSGVGTSSRILEYNLLTKQPEREFLYQTELVTPLFNPTGKFASGLPDLLALNNQGNFLSIERSFTGLGFTVFVFEISLENATDIHNFDSIAKVDPDKIKPVEKKLLLDLRTLDVSLDNVEGLTLGAKLPDGQPSLILISDNNFNGLQQTQILAFKLKIESPLTRLLRRLKIPNF